MPIAAGWLALLIGLADIIVGTEFSPVYRHVGHSLHRLAAVAPGTLTSLTGTADVIIGLLLLMLSHGLRRRKRRAWQAVVVLLAVSLVHPLTCTAIIRGRHDRHRRAAGGPVVASAASSTRWATRAPGGGRWPSSRA